MNRIGAVCRLLLPVDCEMHTAPDSTETRCDACAIEEYTPLRRQATEPG